MTRCIGLRQCIQVGLDNRALELVIARQPIQRGFALAGVAIYLGAIAGGQDGSFLHRRVRSQVAQRLLHAFGMKRHLLTNAERCGLVINAECK